MSFVARHRPKVAEASLLFCTILWGTTFSVTKPLVEPSDPAVAPMGPFVLGAMRLLIGAATLMLYCVLARHRPAEHHRALAGRRAIPWRARLRAYLVPCASLATVTYIGFSSQTVGMQWTTASKSALITGLFVVFVPILSAIMLRRAPSWRVGAAVAVSFSGTALLTLFAEAGGGGPTWGAFGKGEWLTLLCAAIFAVQIIATEFFVIRYDAVLLSIGALLLAGLASVATTFATGESWRLTSPQLLGALYLGLTGTGLCFALATWGQRHVTASRAAIIFGTEPLFGTTFAVLALGDEFTSRMILGAVMILSAIWLSRPLPGQPSPLDEFLRDHGATAPEEVAPAAAPHLAAN